MVTLTLPEPGELGQCLKEERKLRAAFQGGRKAKNQAFCHEESWRSLPLLGHLLRLKSSAHLGLSAPPQPFSLA